MLVTHLRICSRSLLRNNLNKRTNSKVFTHTHEVQNISRSFCFLALNVRSKGSALFSNVRCPVFSKESVNKDLSSAFQSFSVSAHRCANPIIWIVIRPVIKLAAALTGRGFRKWWKDLPPEKRKYFLGVLKQNRVKICGGISFLGLLAYCYYYSHLEAAPITGRRRFMAFDPSQFKLVGEAELKGIRDKYQRLILPFYHPYTRRVKYVISQLLNANKDVKEFEGKNFTISVIDSSEENAFVLPNGEIFVFSGMLKLCSNNDQLGIVLAHELSHCIMAHGAENFSFVHLVDFFMVILIALVWAVLPSDAVAVFTHWFTNQLVEILLHLPYNRKIETEADEVGLEFAAKACFDIRESSAFWAKMAILHKNLDDGVDVEFLSTHPSHETRSSHLDSIMDKGLKLRTECGCPNLKSRDPRLDIERLARILKDERQKYKPHKQILIIQPPVPTS